MMVHSRIRPSHDLEMPIRTVMVMFRLHIVARIVRITQEQIAKPPKTGLRPEKLPFSRRAVDVVEEAEPPPLQSSPVAHIFRGHLMLARPANESRLSCGAKHECSQIEFYNTAWKTFSRSIGDGCRQLQALVRLRATSHSSGPALPRSSRSTHRGCPGTGTRMPSAPTLGTDQARHTGAQRDFHVDSALRIERTYPSDASFDDGADHVVVHNRIRLW